MKKSSLNYFGLLALAAVVCFTPSSVRASGSSSLVIVEAYGGGGNSGATWKSDFICVFNRSASPVDVNGWSVQYASAAGTSWAVTPLAAVSTMIPAGGYFLVKEADGANGAATPLPTPDATGTTAMGAGGFKVALCNSTTALPGVACPSDPSIIDFVGCGGANCFEGSAGAGTPSNLLSVQRNNNGCDDSDDNSFDFTAAAPNPRNSATALNPCTGGGGPVGVINNPHARTNNAGTTATFTVSGSNIVSLVWRKNGSPITDGNANNITTTTLTITNVILANAASYTAELTGVSDSATSSVAVLTVIDPAINTQPLGQIALVGDPVTLSVTAGGTPTLNYQWRTNGINITSATDSSYSIGSAQTTDSGSYTVVVTTNGSGAITSSVAVLSVVVQKTDGLSMIGSGYTTNFDGLGTNGTIKWIEDTTLYGWYASVALPTAPHSVSNYLADSGTSIAGSLYSFGALGSTDRALGSKGANSVGASGGPAFAYGVRFTNNDAIYGKSNIVITYTGEQWHRDGVAVVQTLAFSYRLSDSAINDADVAATQVWTPVHALDFSTPNAATTIVSALDGNDPANRVTLSATVPNLVVLTNKEIFFRWMDLNDSGNDHTVAIDDLSITWDSVIATATKPSIATSPQNVVTNYGRTARFTVTVNGTSPFTYQWRQNGGGLTDVPGKFSGTTEETLIVTNVATLDNASYDVIVQNGAGSVTSAVATLTVNDPGITTQPVSITQVPGDNASFFVAATGSPTLTYQWRTNGVDLAGATDSTLNIANITSNNAASYTVVITNGSLAGITSSVATLTVLPTPIFLIAEWDFNATNTLSASGPVSSIGNGTSALQGGVAGSFGTGTFADSAGAPGALNSCWTTATYPAQGTGNKTAGVRFNVSTVNYGGILLSWEERHSNTASKYARLQYSTDGVNFKDANVITMLDQNNNYVFYSADLTGIPAVNNNPNFAFRIVSEFENTATGSGSAGYVATVTSYGTGGTMRYDLVRVFAGPALAATVSGNNALISWSTNYAGYNLEQKTNLNSAGWTAVGGAVISGSNYVVTLPLKTNAFFHLKKP